MRSKIILVDDDPASLLITKHLIDKYVENCDEFNIKIFEIAVDALSYLSYLIYNLNINKETLMVLLEINMPIIDGWKFLNILDKMDPDKLIKVVIHSSSKNPLEVKLAFSDSRAILYIPKPMDNTKLLELKKAINIKENQNNFISTIEL